MDSKAKLGQDKSYDRRQPNWQQEAQPLGFQKFTTEAYVDESNTLTDRLPISCGANLSNRTPISATATVQELSSPEQLSSREAVPMDPAQGPKTQLPATKFTPEQLTSVSVIAAPIQQKPSPLPPKPITLQPNQSSNMNPDQQGKSIIQSEIGIQ